MLKIFFGFSLNSKALIADGFHSLSDILVDGFTYFANYVGRIPADAKHPYGHAKIESICAFIIALIIISVGLGIVVDAYKEHVSSGVSIYAAYIALATIIANECICRLFLMVNKKLLSSSIAANAYHNRSDAIASLIVFFSVILSDVWGNLYDKVGAIIVGCIILKMGFKIIKNVYIDLTDVAADQKIINKIKEITLNTPGVLALHELKTRKIGGKIFAELHVIVDNYISVSEGHYIGDRVYDSLYKNLPEISHIMVHIDYEDDMSGSTANLLLDREKILDQINKIVAPYIDKSQLHQVIIHYINSKVLIILIMDISLAEKNLESLINISAKEHIKDLDKIILYYFKP